MKIGILDEGVDQTHPFFDPSGYVYPPGFPKGDTAYTTPKVIVARAFAPASVTWRYARKPFDPVYSFHGTHVAGIAAGNDADEWGFGSISSPGSAPGVITAAAASKQKRIAGFSSAGPNPVSLLLKPDVTAPGVGILSSVPAHEGTWAQFSGTSMAS